MKHLLKTFYCLSAAVLLTTTAVLADGLRLQAVQFPEDRDTNIDFVRDADLVPGSLHGEVEFRRGRAEIRLKAEDMKPALALGGEVTSYVAWAAPRFGDPEKLGELVVRDANERFQFTSGLKEFALLVTAEMHPEVERPSSLVLFHNLPAEKKGAKTTSFAFDRFAEAPVYGGTPPWIPPSYDEENLAVLQARRIVEIAESRDASSYAPDMVRDARTALDQAQHFLESSKEERAIDYARRSVALAGNALVTRDNALREQAEAARQAAVDREHDRLRTKAEVAEIRTETLQEELTVQTREKLDLQQQIAEREARLSAMSENAATLAAQQAEAQQLLEEARTRLQALDMDRQDAREEAQRLEAERERLRESVASLAGQQEALKSDREALLAEKGELESENERLQRQKAQAEQEKKIAQNDLQTTLSKIAETKRTARGLVVSLPDILFDIDKATLKSSANQTLAKLAGVLMLVPEVELSVEGHTDSTGTEAHNDWLAKARADSVSEFLVGEGVDPDRLVAKGFGEHQPIADNDTREGRQRNRRVEIVLEGETNVQVGAL
jgi:outer membrane protein OmpA-like peptidoglycan-associated protein